MGVTMYSVLIVEDDPMVAMINGEYVCKNKKFFLAGTCSNGKDALEFLKKNKVDLIVLDLFMPYMDGFETLKKIREEKIPSEVIMVTAANDSATLEECMHLGVLDYLIKPFAFDRFQIALEKFISHHEAFKEKDLLDQKSIDSLISKTPDFNTNIQSQTFKNLPKGIQKNTLKLLLDFLKEKNDWLSVDSISEELNLSIVTVRHYMSYLADEKIILEEVNYSTGGRPSMLYKVSF